MKAGGHIPTCVKPCHVASEHTRDEPYGCSSNDGITFDLDGGVAFGAQFIVYFQVEFYGGSWAWPMISHISMPLAIFYRYLAFLLLEVPHPTDGIFIAHALPQCTMAQALNKFEFKDFAKMIPSASIRPLSLSNSLNFA